MSILHYSLEKVNKYKQIERFIRNSIDISSNMQKKMQGEYTFEFQNDQFSLSVTHFIKNDLEECVTIKYGLKDSSTVENFHLTDEEKVYYFPISEQIYDKYESDFEKMIQIILEDYWL